MIFQSMIAEIYLLRIGHNLSRFAHAVQEITECQQAI